MSETCSCDWETGECQGPIGCKAVAERIGTVDKAAAWDAVAAKNAEIATLRAQLADARKALEAAKPFVDTMKRWAAGNSYEAAYLVDEALASLKGATNA